MYEEYASDGIAAAAAAAKSAGPRPTTRRARKYVGKTTDAITKTSRYLTPAYARATSWISQTGAVRYVYSESNECGSPRRAAWPVVAIERESCVSSSSSVNSHGVARFHASTR